jgi:hypothetical protein
MLKSNKIKNKKDNVMKSQKRKKKSFHAAYKGIAIKVTQSGSDGIWSEKY